MQKSEEHYINGKLKMENGKLGEKERGKREKNCAKHSFFGLPRRAFSTPRNDARRGNFFSRLTSHFSHKKVNDGSKLFPLSSFLFPKNITANCSLNKILHTTHYMPITQRAFTLAEVLITLTIIGVVAAITIPALNNVINDMHYKTAYKKAYSIASQAVMSCVGDGTFVSRTAWVDPTNNTTNWQAFKAKFSIAKDCDGSTVPLSQCWDMTGEIFNGSTDPELADPGFIDNSGMVWVQGSSGGVASSATGDVFIDTNGFKGPNKRGKDRFRLYFTIVTGKNGAPGSSGLPVKIAGDYDYTSYSSYYCNYPPCYFSSWLSN